MNVKSYRNNTFNSGIQSQKNHVLKFVDHDISPFIRMRRRKKQPKNKYNPTISVYLMNVSVKEAELLLKYFRNILIFLMFLFVHYLLQYFACVNFVGQCFFYPILWNIKHLNMSMIPLVKKFVWL